MASGEDQFWGAAVAAATERGNEAVAVAAGRDEGGRFESPRGKILGSSLGSLHQFTLLRRYEIEPMLDAFLLGVNHFAHAVNGVGFG